MSRYDGLIIPRSYSEYINKTDAATLLQALQLSGVMDNAPTANSNHPVKSSGLVPVDAITRNLMSAITSNAVANGLNDYRSNANVVITSDLLKQDLTSIFNSKTNYTTYIAQSNIGAEWGVLGFRHTPTKGGVNLLISVSYGLIIGYGTGTPDNWDYKYVYRV